MMTLRKLDQLPQKIQDRKMFQMLANLQEQFQSGSVWTDSENLFLEGLLQRLAQSLGQTAWSPQDLTPHLVHRLRQQLALKLGIAVAEWDLSMPKDYHRGERQSFPFYGYLEDLRSPFNVGSMIRTAEALGFSGVYMSPFCPDWTQPRAKRSAMGAEALIDIAQIRLEDLKQQWADRPVFALELGGQALHQFQFPTHGLVLLGSEELGLSPEALAWADQSWGRVSIPMYGVKASLNVGVAFGILAAAWTQART